jgi:hypothetical protein
VHRSPAVLVALLVSAALAVPAAPVAAAPVPAGPGAGLPPGWSLTSSGLVWSPEVPLQMGDARLEVHADGHLLGRPRVSPDGRHVTLAPGSARMRDGRTLQVRAAGRVVSGGPTSENPGPVTGPTTPQPSVLPRLPLADDPGRPGPYRVVQGTYTLAPYALSDLPVKAEVEGVVVSPRGAAGRRPFALFLHGRHFTCYHGGSHGEGSAAWPCPPGWKAIPSHRGYLTAQRLLASQGWVTVSISANAVNAQDGLLDDGGAKARSQLVRHHLALWAGWAAGARSWAAAPAAVRAGALPDLRRTLLVGHSRGGEGVDRAAIDSVTGRALPWRVAGQLLIAPTAFGGNNAPGVPTVVLLPACDGDVSDLQGQLYVDGGRDVARDVALRSSVLIGGANHNYFNSEWTPGIAVAPAEDDIQNDRDAVCGRRSPVRLTAAQQRNAARTYTAAAARALVLGDRQAARLLDGSPVRSASAGEARVRSHAVGARRTALLVPGTRTVVRGQGSARVDTCSTGAEPGTRRACATGLTGPTPHFRPVFAVDGEPSRTAVAVRWRGPAATRIATSSPAGLVGARDLALRVVVPAGAPEAGFAVRITDARGRSAELGVARVRGLTAPRSQLGSGIWWAQELRLPLAAARGLDLRHVVKLELGARSATGQLWLLDAWGHRDGGAAAPGLRLPRVDVARSVVKEGSSGTRTVDIPVTVTGTSTTPVVFWLLVGDQRGLEPPVTRTVRLAPGKRRYVVPVKVTGNVLDDYDAALVSVAVLAVRGVVAGDYTGGLEIRDDDPTPTMTVTPVADHVVEGQPLRWHVRLSGPSNIETYLPLRAVAPGRPELSTDDVTPEWLGANAFYDGPPDPPVLLSQDGFVNPFLVIGVGETAVDLVVDTMTDSRTEGPEQVVFAVPDDFPAHGVPADLVLRGTVDDPS